MLLELLMNALTGLSGSSWNLLGPFLASWGDPRELLGPLGALLELLATLCGLLGNSLGAPLELLELLLGALAALFGSSWSHLAPLQAACEARVRRSTVGYGRRVPRRAYNTPIEL